IITHIQNSVCSNRYPSSQPPSPDAALICPTAPASTKRLPQLSAKSRARGRDRYWSLLLATTIEGNGNLFKGTGSNPEVPLGKPGASTSLGATSKAPLIWRSYRSAQCATVIQARL